MSVYKTNHLKTNCLHSLVALNRMYSISQPWAATGTNQPIYVLIEGKCFTIIRKYGFFGTLLIWARLWTKLKHGENYTQQFSISKVTRSWPVPCPECRFTTSPVTYQYTTCRCRPFWKAETSLGPEPRVPAYQQCTTLLVLGQSQQSSTSEPEAQGDLLHSTVAFFFKKNEIEYVQEN